MGMMGQVGMSVSESMLDTGAEGDCGLGIAGGEARNSGCPAGVGMMEVSTRGFVREC